MALIDKASLGADYVWRQRCEIAGVQASTDVMAEPADTPGHDLRANYATRFLNGPSSMSSALATVVAAQPGITGADATDSDIQFTVAAVYNGMAGYGGAAPTPP